MSRSASHKWLLQFRRGFDGLAALCFVLSLATACFAETDPRPLQLTLPPEVFAVAGVETSIYYDNVVPTETPEQYRFEVTCDIGAMEEKRWILLGINDCFGANPEDVTKMDTSIDAMLSQADTLLAAFRDAAPDAELGICLTPPPNAREEGFQANYKGKYHRWGWKRIQHRLVQREMSHFAGREGLFLVPVQLNLDPVDGYPTNNGVHPNEAGYKQIGVSIYSWLKARLEAQSER